MQEFAGRITQWLVRAELLTWVKQVSHQTLENSKQTRYKMSRQKRYESSFSLLSMRDRAQETENERDRA